MRRLLVSSFLAELTQQIHSLRANGVIAAQIRWTSASDAMALRKSAGNSWTTPPAMELLISSSPHYS